MFLPGGESIRAENQFLLNVNFIDNNNCRHKEEVLKRVNK